MNVRNILSIGGGAMGIWDSPIAEVMKHPNMEKEHPV